MRVTTTGSRVRRHRAAAVVALMAALTACSGNGADESAQPPAGATSESSAEPDSDATDGAAGSTTAGGSNTLTVDGVTVEQQWLVACARSEDETKLGVGLMTQDTLDPGAVFATVDLVAQGDGFTASNFFVKGVAGDVEFAPGIAYLRGVQGEDADPSITATRDGDSFVVEGTADEVSSPGESGPDAETRTGVTFTLTVSCTTWMPLDVAGDLANPAGQ